MYLWVSLQIEAIFPSYNEGVLTNESVQDILHHLPKDLPQEFDQALDRIPDRQYGDRIFQLVAVAETSLTGEQLNVALTVQPGDPTWMDSRLPHNPKEVVSCYGGGLLEMDEENNQVRFIHHGVVSHMGNRKVGMDGRSLTQSWLADAESFMGSVCVTYLNIAEFDKRMVLSRRIDPGSISERLKKEPSSYNPLLATMVRHLKRDKHRRPAPEQLNIFTTLLEAQVPKNETIMCFLSYASKLWAQHTAHLTEVDGAKLDVLWRTLIDDRPPHVWVPWSTSPNGKGGMIKYAVQNSHAYLYRHIIKNHLRDDYAFIHRHTTEALGDHPEDEEQARRLDNLVERCIVAGPSFVSTAYVLILQSTPSEDHQFALDMARKHLMELEVGSVVSHLCALIEQACSAVSVHINPKSVHMALAAAFTVLVSLRRLRKSQDPTEEDAFRCLGILSESAAGHCFMMVWDNLPMVAGWAPDAQSLASLALQTAIAQNNFSLVQTITMNIDVDLSIIKHVLGSAKEIANSTFRSKITTQMNPTFHIIKEQPAAGDEGLETIRRHLMNQDYIQATESLWRWLKCERSDFYSVPDTSLLRNIIEWAIFHRSYEFIKKLPLPLISQVVEAWLSVLIDVMTTYAQCGRPGREDDSERERSIFLALLDEAKNHTPNRRYLSRPGFDILADSEWTVLHAATLWQSSYAIDGLFKAWPVIQTRGSRRAWTPVAVAMRTHTLLSPLHCSIACCPPHITRLLVSHGATSAPSFTETEDSMAHTMLMIIALLESRIYYRRSYTRWCSRSKLCTSLEEYYVDSTIPLPLRATKDSTT